MADTAAGMLVCEETNRLAVVVRTDLSAENSTTCFM